MNHIQRAVARINAALETNAPLTERLAVDVLIASGDKRLAPAQAWLARGFDLESLVYAVSRGALEPDDVCSSTECQGSPLGWGVGLDAQGESVGQCKARPHNWSGRRAQSRRVCGGAYSQHGTLTR